MTTRYPDQIFVKHAKFTGCLRTAGMPEDFYQRVIDNAEFRTELVRWVQEKLGLGYTESDEHAAARTIMGSRFLGIPEVQWHFGALSKQQIDALANIPFSSETLEACKNTHILVADIGISLLDVRTKAPQGLFYSYEDAWYNTHAFATSTEQVCWRLIRISPVEGSFSKNWTEQQELLSEHDEVPSARAMCYLIILNHLVTGERLFETVYVRTSSVDGDGDHVLVGDFDGGGLYVDYWGGRVRFSGLGVCSSRKF